MNELVQNNQKSNIKTNNEPILELFDFFKQIYINGKISANLSINTENNINLILDRFYTYIASEITEINKLAINDINRYFLSAYLNHLTSENISKNTQKLHLVTIKNFLSFIADYDIKEFGILKNQINGITIKTEQTEKKSITENEQQRLKKYLEKLDKEKSFLSHRNSLLFKILLYTGARISEILNIKWIDISEVGDQEHGLVYAILLKGKGNKERYTYLLYSEVQDNIDFLKQHAKNHEYLISSTHGGQCNRSMIWLLVKNQLVKAGIAKTGLHIFRHTCARNLVKQNVNLSTIKELLGHSNITITAQFYAKSNETSKLNALIQNTKNNKIKE